MRNIDVGGNRMGPKVASPADQSNGISVFNREIESSLILQFYSSCRGRYQLAILGSLVLAAAIWEVVPHAHILAWSTAVILSNLSTQALCLTIRRTSAADGLIVRWKWKLAASIMLNGLIVGSAGVFLFPAGSMPHQFVLALFLSFFGAVAAVTYSALLPCSITTILLVMLPLCGTFVFQASEYSLTIGTLLLLFTAGLVSAGFRLHRVLLETLKFRYEKDQLIHSLSLEKKRIEELNGELEAEVLERELMAESLKRSEDRYRALVEGQTEFVCRLFGDLTLSFANEAFGRYLRIRPGNLVGRDILEFVHPSDVEGVKEFFHHVKKEASSVSNEYRAKVPGGQVTWLHWSYRAIRDQHGQIKELQGVGRDITAQKKADEALAASEGKYRSLVENAGEGIVVIQESRVKFANPKMLTCTGLSENEMTAALFWDFFQEEDRPVLREIDRTARRGEGPSSGEVRFIGKRGRQLWFQFQGVGLSWEGKPATLGFVRDVTWRKESERALQESYELLEQRVRERTAELERINQKLQKEIADRIQAEASLRDSEQRFRTIFERARDCIFIKDKDLQYTHLNPAMQSLFEAYESDVVGWTDDDLYGPEQARQLQSEDMRVLSGQVIEAEHTLALKGRELTFNCVKVPMMNSAGAIVGLCGIARDVTERLHTKAKGKAGYLEFQANSMNGVLHQVRLAAKSDSLVLLLGESGSGKDFLANHIHRLSNRAGGPFFSINCAALARELAESELFGHEAGSFTGARSRKRGMLELAEGGTLLLNEIGELSLTLQAKLLTFLDTRSFTRVGGEANIEVNARLIAATNRNLRKEVETGRFREDLYHRLNVFSIEVPPLRERLEDLPLLVENILSQLSTKLGLSELPHLDARCVPILTQYHWPGNVRELKNVLERSLILSEGGKIKPESIRLWERQKINDRCGWSLVVDFPNGTQNLNDILKDVKSELVKEALRRTSGVKKEAADLLGISVDSFKYQSKTVGV